MKILFVTSEMAPWVKTGGLGDVAAALPAALRQAGQDVRVLLPHYPALQSAFPAARLLAALPALAPGLPPARLLTVESEGLLLLDCPELYERPGNPYLDSRSRDWGDNGIRFGLLARVAATLAQAWSPLSWRPDIVHANDWQTALAPAYLHYEGGAASVLSVHNIAFQGCFGHELLHALRLPERAWSFDGVEYHGQLSFLKAGLQFASRIATVSPTYAREITDEEFGYGLAPLLRYRADHLRGILNGIDDALWNPSSDPALVAPYAANRLAAKRINKAALQQQLRLTVDDQLPLFAVVSRLTEQKGLDLLLALGEKLASLPAQLALLGSGDAPLEAGFRTLAAAHPDKVSVTLAFDETLAHRIEAGADIFLMPSRFEPCGLNQMYSLAYGTPPIVRATGGLADTVVDTTPATLADGSGDGFVFDEATPSALWQAIERASTLWRDRRAWHRLQQNGMRRDFGWQAAASQYIALYNEAI